MQTSCERNKIYCFFLGYRTYVESFGAQNYNTAPKIINQCPHVTFVYAFTPLEINKKFLISEKSTFPLIQLSDFCGN